MLLFLSTPSQKCIVDLECRIHTLEVSVVLKNFSASLLEVDITVLKLLVILKKCKPEIKIRTAIKIRIFLDL